MDKDGAETDAVLWELVVLWARHFLCEKMHSMHSMRSVRMHCDLPISSWADKAACVIPLIWTDAFMYLVMVCSNA